MTYPLTLIGNEGSPYSRKMRAVLRYRHVPHRWVVQMGPEYVAPPKVPVEVIPVLVWHDADGGMRESMVDSTPQIRRLEREYVGRSLMPSDPALAFLSSLIEDYADEWCTKFMFHYRWSDEAGIAWARVHLMRQINPAVPGEQLAQFSGWFAQRQIERLGVVGSNEETRPVIEAGLRRLLVLLETLVGTRLFLFGNRPSAGDFGLYGQLTQLCQFDPTPVRLTQQLAPRLMAWVVRMEDLSGWQPREGDWLDRDAVLPALRPLLAEIGATHVPFLLANAAARQAGAKEVACQIQGVRWRQQVFPYQVKCLHWLREEYAALPPPDQAWLRRSLEGTGCAALVAA